MPQFETAFYGAQIFWLLISFGFLYLMMSQLICPMIEEVIKERDKKIQTLLNTAEELNAEAADFHQRYQTYLMDAEREKMEKIQKAYQSIHKKTVAAENKNEAKLRQKIRRAEEKINRTTETLEQEADQVSCELATYLAKHLNGEGKNDLL
ncbi:MAG: hypothetical protein IKS41_00850 [Alphaproteobacteria bacterium]|nr:hypothetical protein [Alphaproteobacteria bacterium]